MNICCVSVTYGNRAHLVEQVVDSAIKQGIIRFIIVDNGSAPQSREKLNMIKRKHGEMIHIVSLAENTGSAKGFKTGIEEALKTDNCNFIHLLDDDNKPESNAIAILAERWRMSTMHDKDSMLALCSFRKDRDVFVRLAEGEDIDSCIMINNSVLGFHIANLHHKILKRLSMPSGEKVLRDVFLKYAPYGGLFFNKALIHSIGLPNENYYLYQDDFEFTLRITKNGGKIQLVTDSRIEDIDTAWHEVGKKKFLDISYINDGDDMRVYYSVRNKIHLYHSLLMDNRFLWSVNMALCLSVLWLSAVIYGKKERYQLIRTAIDDGISGRLGKLDKPVV